MFDFLDTRISNQVLNNKGKALAFLQELIRVPSISGQEQEAQLLVRKMLLELGCQIDMWEPDINELKNNPYFVSKRCSFESSPNVVGIINGEGGGRSLILNGHIDVVPAKEEEWENSPWSGHIEGNKVFGRGAVDMKGGLVAMLMAVKCIKDLGIKLKGDLIIESVVEEESGGAGTLACILRGYKADGAIIPEPSALRVFPAQQGSMWFRIKIKGKAAHGATRYEGVSAFQKSCVILKAVEELESKRTASITNTLYKQGPIPFPINIGKVSGGNWPSSVPEEVILEGRMGIIPGEPIEQAKEQLIEAVMEAAKNDPWMQKNLPEVQWFGAHWLSGEISEENDLVNTLANNYEKCMGEEPLFEMSPWATDAGYLINLADTPAVIFGPGPSEKAHFTNEYVEVNQMQKVTEIIAKTIIQWCGVVEK